MKFINKIIPALTSVAIFVLFEVLLKYPKSIYLVVILVSFLIILSIFQLTGRVLLKNSNFLNLAATPLFLFFGGLLFLVFLENVLLRHFVVFLFSVLIFAVLQSITLKFNFRPKYQPHSLENIVNHINSLSVFLIASGFLSLLIFLAIPLWILVFSFSVFIILITIQLLWFSESSIKAAWPYLFVITVLMIEIFWVVSFLPTSIYVGGMILTLTYYLLSGITKNFLLGIRGAKVVKRYLTVTIISLIIILSTAKWF
jgi:hypothetical protein